MQAAFIEVFVGSAQGGGCIIYDEGEKKLQQSDRHQTDGGVENGNQKQSLRIWWKPDDATFHWRHETVRPPSPANSRRREASPSGDVRVLHIEFDCFFLCVFFQEKAVH